MLPQGVEELKALYRREMLEVEHLVRTGRGSALTLRELWHLQREALDAQVESQLGMDQARATAAQLKHTMAGEIARKEGGWRHRVQSLQSDIKHLDGRYAVHQHAFRLLRVFNDSMVWGVCQRLGNWPAVALLGNHDPVGRIPTGRPLQVVLALAECLMNAGMGFPFIHDATNVLRTGDLTLVHPTLGLIMFEVKAPETGTRVSAFGHFSAEAWDTLKRAVGAELDEPGEVRSVPDRQQAYRRDPRIDRQNARLADVHALSTAGPDTPVSTSDGIHAFTRGGMREIQDHWATVGELADAARRGGYAAEVVDEHLLYVATYDDEPFRYPWEARGELPHLSRILAETDRRMGWPPRHAPNPLFIGGTWDRLRGPSPLEVMPFIGYPLPVDTIIEMLHGRMLVAVCVDLGGFLRALNEVDIRGTVVKQSQQYRDRLETIRIASEQLDGGEGDVIFDGAQLLVHEMVYQFTSFPGTVERAHRLLAQALETLKDDLGE